MGADYNRKNLPRSLCSLCRHVLSLALIGFTVFTYLLGKIDTSICRSVRKRQPSQLCLCRNHVQLSKRYLNSLNMGCVIWLPTALWLATAKRNRFTLKLCQWGAWNFFLFSKSFCHQWTDHSVDISLLDLLSLWDDKVNGLLRESTSQSFIHLSNKYLSITYQVARTNLLIERKRWTDPALPLTGETDIWQITSNVHF